MVAIIPAAGKGERMREVTGGDPKELLPVGGKLVLERIVEEAFDAGLTDVVVVSSKDKPEVSAAATKLGARVVIQARPLGLADAIATAQVEDDALVLFGDCVFHPSSPSERLAALVYRGIEGAIAVEEVSDEETRLYGIVEVDERTGAIERLVEKPGPENTTSRWAVAARMAFGAPFMSFLAEQTARHGIARPNAEIQLTAILESAIEAGMDIKAVPLQPDQRRLDCGSVEGYRLTFAMRW